MTTFFGDADTDDLTSELTGTQIGGAQILGPYNGSDTAYGDVFALRDQSRGGNDSLIAAGRQNVLFGDADTMEDDAVGGDDNLTAAGKQNVLYGDAFEMRDNAVGGNDSLTAAGTRNFLVGDAFVMYDDSVGGNDSLTATGTRNFLVGDAVVMFGDAVGGNDILTVTGDKNFLAGDGGTMFSGAIGGNDILTATGNDNVLYGDSPEMFFGAIGGSDTFVFGSDNGTATIVDYNRIQGVGGTESDRIDLTAAVNGEGAALTWDDLDTNGNNVLDDGDDFITTGALSDLRIADDTAIDLGAAAGGPAGVNVLTIERLTDLVETDFVFA